MSYLLISSADLADFREFCTRELPNIPLLRLYQKRSSLLKNSSLHFEVRTGGTF